MKLVPYGNQVGANYKLKEILLQRLLHKYFTAHFLVHCGASTHQIGSTCRNSVPARWLGLRMIEERKMIAATIVAA